MQKSETAIRRRIERALRGEGWRVIKIHGSRYQEAGLPDLLALRAGRYLWLEVKAPGGVVSPLQAAKHAELRAHGAAVAVVDSVEGALACAE